MAEFPSLPLYTDAYIADTQHLTNEEHGVYLRLLMFTWRSKDCALPNDDKRLALMVGVTPKKWAALKDVVMSFWTLTELGWQQHRLTFERQRVAKLMAQKSDAGKASARAKHRKTKDPGLTSVATGGVTAQQQPEPYPEPEYKKETPNGVSKKPERAKRLPKDWTLPDEYREWAEAQGWPADTVVFEAEKFRDFWASKGGRDAAKLDWLATWRNWMRNCKVSPLKRDGPKDFAPTEGETANIIAQLEADERKRQR